MLSLLSSKFLLLEKSSNVTYNCINITNINNVSNNIENIDSHNDNKNICENNINQNHKKDSSHSSVNNFYTDLNLASFDKIQSCDNNDNNYMHLNEYNDNYSTINLGIDHNINGNENEFDYNSYIDQNNNFSKINTENDERQYHNDDISVSNHSSSYYINKNNP